MAEIAEAGFDTFLETDTGFEAYCEEVKADLAPVEDIKIQVRACSTLFFFVTGYTSRTGMKNGKRTLNPLLRGRTLPDPC